MRLDYTPGRVRPEAMLAGVAKGLNQGLEVLAAAALPVTPKDTGRLRGSQKITRATAGNRQGAVSYDTPYAVIQHENLGYHHTTPGTSAKYLERPLLANREKMLQAVANGVREAL